MNKKNDYILVLTALLLLVLVGGIVRFFGEGKYKSDQVQAPKIIGSASLTIEFAGNNTRKFEGEIIENETLLDALNQASKVGVFSYKLDKENNLAAIEKFVKNDKKSWYWRLNDEKITKPLNEIILKAGDKIMVKYE